jgi:hypothetical protein
VTITQLQLPVLKGLIRRRILLNYSADPAVVQGQLPPPFRPKLHGDRAVIGVCLIRLEQIRPRGLPGFVGISSENAAHRIAVLWDSPDGTVKEGVYIPRRDTGSMLNSLAGGRLFPGEHHLADFHVDETEQFIHLKMLSRDQAVRVEVQGTVSTSFPETSIFSDVTEASRFFEGGCIGYSPRIKTTGLDGIVLNTKVWQVDPLEVSTASSSYFEDHGLFPAGSVKLDHALLMRDIPHEWTSDAPAL